MATDPPKFDEIEDILATYREPAIMLHRPYPPSKLPAVRSRLGGLPNLPPTVDWPHGRSPRGEDVPLHFLAQIDCAELPDIGADLPDEGVLFFFARDDEEQIWGKKNARHHARVIYLKSVPHEQPVREAPVDLRPIRDCVAAQSYKPAWVLPDEAGPEIHFSWPVIALPFDTWPDAGALSVAVGDDYTRRLEARRAGAFIAATGLPSRSASVPDWDHNSGAPFSLPKDRYGNTRFPQAGIMIDRVARRIVTAHQHRKAQPQQVAEIRDKAFQWIVRAATIGLDAAAPVDAVDAFQGWLNELAGEKSYLRSAVPEILTEGIADAITFAAGSPGAAALIPRHYYDVTENRHLSIRQEKIPNTGWRLQTRVHQMLGHAPATQNAEPVDGGPICLLQLASDSGIAFMFGDVGEASFWISPADLVAKRFDRAWATLAGH